VRLTITKHLADGTIVDGTAAWEERRDGTARVWDFRDLDGEPMILEPGASFHVEANQTR
jgi:hypothetical protein